jgi:hypothetical protein
MEVVFIVLFVVIALMVLSVFSDLAGDILEVGCMLVFAAIGVAILIVMAKVFNVFG